MQRGILSLSKEESALITQLVQTSSQNLSNLLGKLQLAINSNEEVSTIEVNSDEVEAILDNMPIPKEGENEIYQVIRGKLTGFLAKKYQ